MKIDPNKTWRLVEERLSTETDPAVRHNLELVRDHMRAEAVADIEGVVATLCDTPEYVMHNNPDDTRTNPKGSKDAVRGFYDATIVQTGAHRLEFDCERVIADAHSVFTEGVMRMAYPGRTLAAMGIEVDDPDGYYVAESRMGIVWPRDPASGFLTGEEVYSSNDAFDGIAGRKISLADVAEIVVA
ncbi:MAG: nuclear transport factor 2 family protein [Acidimicrobiales bacterium]|nr:nuclear transport factor 2 family protein [Acidimicrobiales bacterium]